MRDLIVKICVRLGIYKPMVEMLNRLKFRREARRMHRNGLEMLRASQEACNKVGIKAFLTYGVLLGAVREHDFISYDADLDLGILADEVDIYELHRVLSDASFRLVKQNYFPTTKQVIEETYDYKGLHFDIFYYFVDCDDWFSYIPRSHEYKEWKEANETDGFPCDRSYVPQCGFEQINFLGVQVWVPEDTNGWLRAIYSNSYMTPIKNWKATDYKTRIVPTDERCYRNIIK